MTIEDVQEKIHGCDLLTPFELFGVECDKGWYPLVKKAIAAVARYNGVQYTGFSSGTYLKK